MYENSDFAGSIKQDDAVAFFRYTVILPLIEAEPGTIRKTAYDIAHKVFNDPVNKKTITFGERTIFTYYANYRKYGFEGLKPKQKSKGNYPSIPQNIIKDILNLKEELPTRTSQKIVTLLELSNRIEADSLNVRTVSRILKHYGFTRQALAKQNRVFVKHEKEAVNLMWQSDVMQGFYIPDANGENRLVYLIGFIDDHSRRILHCQFYFDATLTRLEDCLKKAVIKFGVPKSLYVDNGKIFISDDFKLICAKLGITLKYSTPYKPSGKGKIEVFWKYVESSFMPEIRLTKISNIIELNDIFQGWLQEEYLNKKHSSLDDETPIERWETSIKNGVKLKFIPPVELDETFLHFAQRTVNKYGTISFEGNTYEIDGVLVGKKITLRYNPFHLDYVHVYFNDKYYDIAKIIDLKTERHKSVGHIEEDHCVDSEISKQYLNSIKSKYQNYLEQQIKLNINKENAVSKISAKSVKPDDNKEPIGFRPPSEIQFSIDRKTFISIIAASLNIDTFTFAEKGRLYELWDTFKDFNEDILTSILTDIKVKSSNYNNNFLYYLAELKNLYLSKLKVQKRNEGVDQNEH